MFNISKIIESISGKHQNILLERSLIAELIQKELGIFIEPKQVVVSRGVLSLLIKDQTVKNELYIKKQKLLTAIQSKFPKLSVSEIRIA